MSVANAFAACLHLVSRDCCLCTLLEVQQETRLNKNATGKSVAFEKIRQYINFHIDCSGNPMIGWPVDYFAVITLMARVDQYSNLVLGMTKCHTLLKPITREAGGIIIFFSQTNFTLRTDPRQLLWRKLPCPMSREVSMHTSKGGSPAFSLKRGATWRTFGAYERSSCEFFSENLGLCSSG